MQGIDVPDEQVRATFQQTDGKEMGTARYAVAAIVRHGCIVLPFLMRRNAHKGLPPYGFYTSAYTLFKNGYEMSSHSGKFPAQSEQ